MIKHVKNADFAGTLKLSLHGRKITTSRSRTGRENDFDFALLELSEEIDLTGASNARAITLATAADLNFDKSTEFIVSGWGQMRSGGRKPKKLHFVTLPWISEKQCKKKYNAHITSRMICAGDLKYGGIDSCRGDSGGIERTKIIDRVHQIVLPHYISIQDH